MKDTLISKRKKLQYKFSHSTMPIKQVLDCIFSEIEQQDKDFIKNLKSDLCLEGYTENGYPCNKCVICNSINENAGEDLLK